MSQGTVSLIAGLAAPFSVILALPGLTEYWGSTSHVREPYLVILLGFSLVFAMLANFALVLRIGTNHPRLATFIAVTFLSLHGILSITAPIIYAVKYIDGQLPVTFWLTIFSAIIAFTIVGLFVIEGITRGWKYNGGVTGKERSLTLSFTLFAMIIMLGCICFKLVHGLILEDHQIELRAL